MIEDLSDVHHANSKKLVSNFEGPGTSHKNNWDNQNVDYSWPEGPTMLVLITLS